MNDCSYRCSATHLKMFAKWALILCVFQWGTISVWAKSPIYIVGVEDALYYPHYSYHKDTGFRGAYREILDLFAREKGITFEYRAYPIPRLFQYLYKKRIDFKYPDNAHWQKEQKRGLKVEYSEPVISYTDGLLVRPERLGYSMQQLNIIGTIRGFTPVEYIKLARQGKLKVSEYDSIESLLKKAIDAEVDGAYINIEVARHILRTSLYNENALVFDSDLPHHRGSYRLSTIKHPQLIKSFNRFLNKQKLQVTSIKKKFNLD